MTERIVGTNGVELWTESFGEPADPAILLIMGATAQGIWWDEEFCQQLVDARRYVIRYDNRDVGQSSTIDFVNAPYGVSDLVEDAVGILDAYGLKSAHLVGAAIGGEVAYLMGLEHASRVETITLIWSSLAIHEVALSLTGTTVEIDLPMPQPDVVARVGEMLKKPPTNREEHIRQRAEIIMSGAGSLYPADPILVYELMSREYDRARDWKAKNNHIYVSAGSPSAKELRQRLGKLDKPTLVIHGTEDRDLTIEHGEALVTAIPGASLLPIQGLGHQFHRSAHPIMTGAIIDHTNRSILTDSFTDQEQKR